MLRLRRRDRRKLVICGIGAGFATVFGTPIAGAVFGLEVLVLGTLMYDVLYPSFVAGIVGYQVASRLGVSYFHQALYEIPHPTEGILLKTIAAGVIFGLVALLLIETMRWSIGSSTLPAPGWVVALGGGTPGGTGVDDVGPLPGARHPDPGSVHPGAWIPTDAALLKIVFTAISLGTGGSGGIVTPIFFIGATAGSTLGALGFDRGTFAAIGMVSLLAGATNTPLAASIMAIELFGPAVAPFAAISCIVSFLMVGHRSVYPSQILGIAKTLSVRIPRRVEVGDLVGLKTRRWRLRRLVVIGKALRRVGARLRLW